jgi:hypothetical protein
MSCSARRLRCAPPQRGSERPREYRYRCDGPILRSPPQTHSSQRSHCEAKPRYVHHYRRKTDWNGGRVDNEEACSVAPTQRSMRSATEGGPIIRVPTTVSLGDIFRNSTETPTEGSHRTRQNQSGETISNRRLGLVSKSFIEHAERRNADCNSPSRRRRW